MEYPSPDQLQALLRSPEATRLLSVLQGIPSETLHLAVQAAKQGDCAKVQSILNTSLQGSPAEALAQALERQYG